MSKYNVVLFDLDGTLLDTSEGIYNSVRFAEKNMGFEPLSQEELKSFIGPPPVMSYMHNYGVSKDIAMEATKYHRQYGFERGVYEARIYDGIPGLLTRLKSQGIKLGVCTLKRQDVTEKVLKHFLLYHFFDAVVGINDDESLTKADTINIALDNLSHNDRADVVLIGDSMYDAEGAEGAGINFIGALYGFGFNETDELGFCSINNIRELMHLFRNAN